MKELHRPCHAHQPMSTHLPSKAVKANFCLSTLQKHVRKVVGGFEKKSCVSTSVRKPGNAYASTDHHDMTLAVKVAVNPNTTNQPKLSKRIFASHLCKSM